MQSIVVFGGGVPAVLRADINAAAVTQSAYRRAAGTYRSCAIRSHILATHS